MLPLPPILSQFHSQNQKSMFYFVSIVSYSNYLHFDGFLLLAIAVLLAADEVYLEIYVS